jgi:hypothetical protein
MAGAGMNSQINSSGTNAAYSKCLQDAASNRGQGVVGAEQIAAYSGGRIGAVLGAIGGGAAGAAVSGPAGAALGAALGAGLGMAVGELALDVPLVGGVELYNQFVQKPKDEEACQKQTTATE